MARTQVDILGPFTTEQWDEGIALLYKGQFLNQNCQVVEKPYFFSSRWSAISIVLDAPAGTSFSKPAVKPDPFEIGGAL